jgi:hypothetical protein
MMKRLRIDGSSFGYVLLLTTFAALGLFVAALATGSSAAALIGAVMAGCAAGAVAGFRSAARNLANSELGREAGSAVSIFSIPLRQDQIGRYLDRYRTDPASPAGSEMTGAERTAAKRKPEYQRAA